MMNASSARILAATSLVLALTGCPKARRIALAPAIPAATSTFDVSKLALSAEGWDVKYEPEARQRVATRAVAAPNNSTWMVRVFLAERVLPLGASDLEDHVTEKSWAATGCGSSWISVTAKGKLDDGGAWLKGRSKEPGARGEALRLLVVREVGGHRLAAWSDDLHTDEAFDEALALVKSAKAP